MRRPLGRLFSPLPVSYQPPGPSAGLALQFFAPWIGSEGLPRRGRYFADVRVLFKSHHCRFINRPPLEKHSFSSILNFSYPPLGWFKHPNTEGVALGTTLNYKQHRQDYEVQKKSSHVMYHNLWKIKSFLKKTIILNQLTGSCVQTRQNTHVFFNSFHPPPHDPDPPLLH